MGGNNKIMISPYVLPGIPKYQKSSATTIELIINEVCNGYNISPELIKKPSRKNEFVKCRAACYWFLRKYTILSLVAVGRQFNRDHTSVMWSLQNYENNFERRDRESMEIVRIHHKIEEKFSILIR